MHIIDIGENARVERRARAEYKPVVNQETGEPILHPLTKEPLYEVICDSNGDPVYIWVVYEKVLVKDGVHPVLNEKTSHEHVWVIRGQGTEQEARSIAEKIASIDEGAK